MPSTERDGRPSAFVWLIALISLVLPIVGVGAAIYGTLLVFKQELWGWLWLAGGLAILVGDIVLDKNWVHWTKSSEPDLNRRGDQLIGRVLTVVDAIEPGGRGSVRAADGVWPAEGDEAAAGARVRVTGCNGTVLTVENS
jgi:membrane protein implicated in regulation of membrane protease activity